MNLLDVFKFIVIGLYLICGYIAYKDGLNNDILIAFMGVFCINLIYRFVVGIPDKIKEEDKDDKPRYYKFD